MKHLIKFTRLAIVAPFFNIYLLPTIRSRHCFTP
uniref:Uncharacterized protein n=1 Tax=Medicago truncatula TaxID=3880 RepID=I3SI05_MEDTR|nr:unknown [Medicago truncatula]